MIFMPELLFKSVRQFLKAIALRYSSDIRWYSQPAATGQIVSAVQMSGVDWNSRFILMCVISLVGGNWWMPLQNTRARSHSPLSGIGNTFAVRGWDGQIWWQKFGWCAVPGNSNWKVDAARSAYWRGSTTNSQPAAWKRRKGKQQTWFLDNSHTLEALQTRDAALK